MRGSTPEESNTPSSTPQPTQVPEANPMDQSANVSTQTFELEARWDYSSLGVEDIPAALSALEQRVNNFESVRSEITYSITAERFMEILAEYDEIAGDRYAIELRAELPICADTKDEAAMAQESHVSSALADMGQKLVFFDLAFQALSDEKAHEIIEASGKFKHYLEQIRAEKPHTLSEAEEKLLTATSPNGITALIAVGDIIRSKLEFDFRGEKLNNAQIREKYHSGDRAVREEAYEVSLATIDTVKEELGKIYMARVNNWRVMNGEGYRKYPRPISARNFANDLPDEAIDTLLAVCRKNHGIFQDFFELKRQRLGFDTFERHDVYAPVASTDVTLTYQQATELVLTALDDFSPRFGSIARAIQTTGHVDAAVRKNKQGGAFCAGGGLTSLPFVLENFTGTVNDASTKAHELGHGIHDVLAQQQTNLTWHPGLPVAETASTFCEHVFGDFLAKERPELAEYLLFESLSGHYATIIRQATFTDFEVAAHELIKDGAKISDLNEVYLNGLREQLGPNINVHERFEQEWMKVPHFVHAPFYVPAYSFGELFSLALFQMSKDEGPSFAREVEGLLALGGSVSPVELCGRVGFDVTNPDHWQRGFDLVASKVDHLRTLVEGH